MATSEHASAPSGSDGGGGVADEGDTEGGDDDAREAGDGVSVDDEFGPDLSLEQLTAIVTATIVPAIMIPFNRMHILPHISETSRSRHSPRRCRNQWLCRFVGRTSENSETRYKRVL